MEPCKLKNSNTSFLIIVISSVGGLFAMAGLALFAVWWFTPDANSQFQPWKTITTSDPTRAAVYFNSAEKFNTTYPLAAEKRMRDILREHISRAKEEIYIAVYSLSIKELAKDLKKAHDRGVSVHIVYDEKKKSRFLSIFWSSRKLFDMTEAKTFPEGNPQARGGIMHHKFMVIDPDNARDAVVLTGSWNWTTFQEKYDPSNVIVIRDHDVAQAYKNEFERMKKGFNGAAKRKIEGYNPFHILKTCKDGALEVWFSPRTRSTGFSDRIRECIRQSEKSIYFINWYFTDDAIADELLKRYHEGVEIKGVSGDANFWGKSSLLPNMWGKKHNKKAGIWTPPLQTLVTDHFRSSRNNHSFTPEEKIYAGRSSYIHQHVMIIDEKTVITGAGNWTAGADWLNDEDGLIFTQKKIVDVFLDNFYHHYSALGGVLPKSELAVSISPKPLAIKILNRSDAPKNLHGYKLVSIDTPYKNTFETSMIHEQVLDKASIQPREEYVLDASDMIDRLFPVKSRNHPMELYLLNDQSRLTASVRFFP